MSKYNEKSKAYTIEYIKNNYDEIKLRLPIGTKDIIKQHIEQYKDMLPLDMQSMQGFIKAAINEKLANDTIQEKEYDYVNSSPKGNG